MEYPNTSNERIENTDDDHPKNASVKYKYDESRLNKLELQYAAAKQDYAEKYKAYMDAKESNMKETDADNYNILDEEQKKALCRCVQVKSKLQKEREFVNLVRFITDDHPKNASEEYFLRIHMQALRTYLK